MIIGYDQSPFDPGDYPDADTLEQARARVFPESLPGVTRTQENFCVAAVLCLRTKGALFRGREGNTAPPRDVGSVPCPDLLFDRESDEAHRRRTGDMAEHGRSAQGSI